MKCPLCSREQDADAVFCTACGKKIPRCPACGTVLYKRSRFCVVDGTPLPENLFAGFPPEPEPEPAPAVSMTAITSVDASSYLSESQYSLYHTPDRIMDGDLATAWVEDGTGEGIDESITFTFDSVYLVSGMCIHAGYQKSAELYEKNARPASLTILFSSGETQTVTLQDVNGPQDIVFPAPVETASITLVISSVYSGSKYTDTAVSEISFY